MAGRHTELRPRRAAARAAESSVERMLSVHENDGGPSWLGC